MLGEHRGLPRLRVGLELTRVAAGVLLGVRLDAGLHESRAERLDLIAHRGADVERLHDGAEPTAGRDRLKSRDARSQDERPRRGDRSGSGHHQREDAREPNSGDDRSVVSRERRHRREHVHVLGAADARHRLEAKCRDAAVDERAKQRGIPGRFENADEDRAALELGHERHVGAAHHNDDVGVGEQCRAVGRHLGSNLDVCGVGDPCGGPGPGLNGYRCTGGHQLRCRAWDERDPSLAGRRLCGGGDAHAAWGLYGSAMRTRC